MKSNKKTLPVNFNKLSEKSQRSWTIPEIYTDEIYSCIDCGESCVFTAIQQQEWYEIQKKYYWERPVRCQVHYMQWKNKKLTKTSMDQKLNKLKEKPNDINCLFEYAKSIIEYHKANGKGNLQIAISILKKVNETGELYKYCRENL